jgi:long-chain acyl-CoA synthetase
VRLSDIPPAGVRVRLLGTHHGKSVYRVTVQTRLHGTFDLAVNVNHDLTPDQVHEEVQWLILSGEPGPREPLVEEFGGYWPEQDLWSEEFIAGETLDRSMDRLARLPAGPERLCRLWPFMTWAALSAYIDFWHRADNRLEIEDPGPKNVIVPSEDFLSGLRLVSVSQRRPHAGLLPMLRRFRDEFVSPAEARHPFLSGLVDWSVIFSALLEVLGEVDGLRRLRQALADADLQTGDRHADPQMERALREMIARVTDQGFVPMRLFFAIERYRRWARLNADPTPQARGRMLVELDETYGLRHLAARYPESRVRFFVETVFHDSPAPLRADLEQLVLAMRERRLGPDGLLDAVDELRARHAPGRDEEYFLARLSYPYLRPQDEADFVTADLGGKRQGEIVVSLEDRDGNAYRVRHALNPREVERLFRLFLAARLDVRFRMEHRYLVAINERGQIIGGIYYEIDESGGTAHLEKIVVADRYRGRGVAEGLMHEFFNRLRAFGVTAVTTGFFLPEYFAGHGFRVDQRYSGVVKRLEEGSG